MVTNGLPAIVQKQHHPSNSYSGSALICIDCQGCCSKVPQKIGSRIDPELWSYLNLPLVQIVAQYICMGNFNTGTTRWESRRGEGDKEGCKIDILANTSSTYATQHCMHEAVIVCTYHDVNY